MLFGSGTLNDAREVVSSSTQSLAKIGNGFKSSTDVKMSVRDLRMQIFRQDGRGFQCLYSTFGVEFIPELRDG